MDLQTLFSIEGIAEYLGDSKETVCLWLECTKIPAHRIGKPWKFKPFEVDQWGMSGGEITDFDKSK